MDINQARLDGIKPNTSNPRQIKEDKFAKLVNSILVFPKMLELRPLVVDDDGTILGGNMRYRALQHIAGMQEDELVQRLVSVGEFGSLPQKKRQALLGYWRRFLDKPSVPVCKASGMTDAEKQAFIIKDNVGYGEWDWDMLANEWDADLMNDWGIDVWREDEQNKNNGKESDREDEKINFFDKMLDDRIYDSDNEFEIPTIMTERQPERGLILPFSGWGTDTRAKKNIRAYHFYVEDYRFESIWKDPSVVLDSGCEVLVEPNLSLFDTTPIAYGLQQIYKKRWIARYFQECGVKVYADLNVSRKFYKYNKLGIPNGYDAFATRGYADRMEYLKEEFQIARELSGRDNPNMIVYGGGNAVRDFCLQHSILYVEQFMANKGGRGNE